MASDDIKRIVRLKGPSGPLSEIQSYLKGDTRIREDQGAFYLESQSFKNCNSAEELFLDAETLAASLNGLNRLIFYNTGEIRVDNVYFGTQVTSSLTSFTSGKPAIDPSGPLSQIDKYLDLSLQNQHVADALVFLGRGPNWFNLYKVYEIVRSDCRGDENIEKKLRVPKSQCDLFRRTANHSKAVGRDARHAASKEQAPTNPMSLEQGTKFVYSLFDEWVKTL